MLYFTILLISSALALTSAQYDCDLGEDYWCSSLRNAKACNAVNKCLDVWSKSPESDIQVALCMSCRRVVSDLMSAFYDHKEIVQGMCEVFKHKNERMECLEDRRNWTPGDLEENIAGLACATLISCKLPEDGGDQREAKLVHGQKRKRSLDTLLKRTGDAFHWMSLISRKIKDANIPIVGKLLKTAQILYE